MAAAKELRSLSVEELGRLVSENREAIFRQRIKHHTGALESTADLSKKRRELARILTVLTEKETSKE
jgi:ribosomal protein L29